MTPREGNFAEAVAHIRALVASDPDLNLYLLAFDCPDIEEACLHVASELVGVGDTP